MEDGTPTGSDPTPLDRPVDVFADLSTEEAEPYDPRADSEGWPAQAPKRDPAGWRRDGPPPRAESIRASRDGGRLVDDRGSLSRRLSHADGVPVDDAESAETAEFPAGPAWQMPTRAGSLPGGDDRRRSTPGEAWPQAPADVNTSGSIPGFLLRGRPQSELYASEHSVPPQDPMVADLVAGRVTNEFEVPTSLPLPDFDEPPIHGTFGDVPGPAGAGNQLPPITWERADSDEIPAVWTDEGIPSVDGQPRVVPPGRARRYSQSRRRDPRGRAVATHPDAFGSGSVPSDGGPEPISVERAPPVYPPPPDGYAGVPDLPGPPPAPRRRTSPGAPARPATTPGAAPPRPPAADEPASTGTVPPVVWRLVVLAVALFGLLAAINTLTMFRARSALARTLDIGIGPNGPTPDLPHVLRSRLAELDLEPQIEAFHSEIAGSSDSYRVGVHMETRIAGYPVGWTAIREGTFKVDKRIRALSVYVAAGWELDSDAIDRLNAYTRQRKTAREEARRPPPPVLGDDDDSGGDDDDSAPSTPPPQ